MIRHIRIVSMVGATLVSTALLGSIALADPFIARPIHAPETAKPTGPPTVGKSSTSHSDSSSTTVTPTPNITPGTHDSGSTTNGEDTASTAKAEVKERLQTAQLKVCDKHATTIVVIMTRADTRAQNQITLFTTIATRVEGYYTTKGKTIATYDQLVTAVNTARIQASTDLATLQASGSFSCSANNPRGAVSTYRSELQAVQTDVKNLRTAVKNLIVGVAQAEGVTLPQSSTSGGQQ
jgi:hypothetical protein